MNYSQSVNDTDHIVVLNFKTLRNISTKQDLEQGRKILTGYVPTKELLKLGKDSGDGIVTTNIADKSANVRDAARLKKGGMISVSSGVPSMIYSSLSNDADTFHLLNGGITILCDKSILNKDRDNQISLTNPSIANGGHTHDVIRRFHSENPDTNALCRVEIIYIDHKKTGNSGLNNEISIARNQQKKVQEVSTDGKRGILDDLYWINNEEIGRSETDTDLFDPLKALQVSFLLTPNSLWNEWDGKDLARASIYSAKSKTLRMYRDFSLNNENAKNFIDRISVTAKKIYIEFQNTDLILNKKGLPFKQLEENSYVKLNNGKYKLKDGWIMPLISSLSYFVDVKKATLDTPSKDILIGIMAKIYELGYAEKKDVQLLGKNSLVYSQVLEFLPMGEKFLINKGKEVFK